MKSPVISVSWGELLDKITILEIKLTKLTAKEALENVEREFKLLKEVFTDSSSGDIKAAQFKEQLRSVNEKLWDIEDQIRDKERHQVFDEEFIQLARSVYIVNDERSRIKRQINQVFGSDLVEEKSYSDYQTPVSKPTSQ